MEVTIKDIAKKIGISYATVSRALNNRAGVNPETREIVLEMAKKMGYQPNAIARGLVMKYTHTIALVIPDITNPFFPEIVRTVEDVASELGYNTFLCNTNWDIEKEQSYLKLLQEKRVDGIILKPASDSEGNSFGNISVPLVLLDRTSKDDVYSCIEVDDKRGGFLATKHLIESGYKKIAFIGGKLDSYSDSQRKEGYMQALSRYKYEIDETLIKNGSFKTKSGYEIMNNLIKSGNTPDAVFAGNDVIALGVMQSAKENGLDVPGDLGIVGYDDIDYAKLPQIQLTTIAQPKYQIGRCAVELLLKEINDRENKVSKIVILEPELIIRSTTREIKMW
ncbi:MAG TPA: LacI family DNA-binding transcriptional regulator [Clostridia bacterium]|nr:LacI family DNA-binding transcriptional regulator [Clostridia bacterium]